MEKLNLNFSGGDNVVKSICWIMSYLSWLLLVATGWASIKWLDEEPSLIDKHIGWFIWIFKAVRTSKGGSDPLEGYLPFQMQVSLYYICFILTLIVITCGCVIFFVKTIFKKDDEVGIIDIELGEKRKERVVTTEEIIDLVDYNNENNKYSYKIKYYKVSAPIKKGDVVGTIKIKKDGKVIITSNLTVKNDVKKITFFKLLKRMLTLLILGFNY